MPSKTTKRKVTEAENGPTRKNSAIKKVKNVSNEEKVKKAKKTNGKEVKLAENHANNAINALFMTPFCNSVWTNMQKYMESMKFADICLRAKFSAKDFWMSKIVLASHCPGLEEAIFNNPENEPLELDINENQLDAIFELIFKRKCQIGRQNVEEFVEILKIVGMSENVRFFASSNELTLEDFGIKPGFTKVENFEHMSLEELCELSPKGLHNAVCAICLKTMIKGNVKRHIRETHLKKNEKNKK